MRVSTKFITVYPVQFCQRSILMFHYVMISEQTVEKASSRSRGPGGLPPPPLLKLVKNQTAAMPCHAISFASHWTPLDKFLDPLLKAVM